MSGSLCAHSASLEDLNTSAENLDQVWKSEVPWSKSPGLGGAGRASMGCDLRANAVQLRSDAHEAWKAKANPTEVDRTRYGTILRKATAVAARAERIARRNDLECSDVLGESPTPTTTAASKRAGTTLPTVVVDVNGRPGRSNDLGRVQAQDPRSDQALPVEVLTTQLLDVAATYSGAGGPTGTTFLQEGSDGKVLLAPGQKHVLAWVVSDREEPPEVKLVPGSPTLSAWEFKHAAFPDCGVPAAPAGAAPTPIPPVAITLGGVATNVPMARDSSNTLTGQVIVGGGTFDLSAMCSNAAGPVPGITVVGPSGVKPESVSVGGVVVTSPSAPRPRFATQAEKNAAVAADSVCAPDAGLTASARAAWPKAGSGWVYACPMPTPDTGQVLVRMDPSSTGPVPIPTAYAPSVLRASLDAVELRAQAGSGAVTAYSVDVKGGSDRVALVPTLTSGDWKLSLRATGMRGDAPVVVESAVGTLKVKEGPPEVGPVAIHVGLLTRDTLRSIVFAGTVSPVWFPRHYERFFEREKGFGGIYVPVPVAGIRLGTQSDDVLAMTLGLGQNLVPGLMIVAGLEFGTRHITETWQPERSWFVGITMSPGIFDKLVRAGRRNSDN